MVDWLKSYNFDDNIDKTLKIMKDFNIDRYHFSVVNGQTSLIVDVGLNNYKIELDVYKKEMIVKKKQFMRRGSKNQKEYMRTVYRVSENCIYKSIEWINKNSKKI